MDRKKRIRIGDLLIEHKFISETQLENALAEQKKTRRKLGKTLIDLGYIEEKQLLELLAEQLGITYSDLRLFEIDTDVLHRLPEILARRFRAIALKEENGNVVVGMTDPTDIYAFDEIQKILEQPLQIIAISEGDLLHNLDTGYRKTEEIDNLAEVLDEEMSDHDFDLQSLTQTTNTADAPVVKLLQAIFEDAISIQASDIHIEPDHNVLR
ncbi:MAG TPA: MSHA biogenesis protein MshE, partial [Methylophaga sp.]|nr:MSHA biogenesis protein MshE [Methylophaga sp.]